MKAALYARVSSDSQDVDLSISAQLRSLRDYATKHDYQIVGEYVDEAESGRTSHRPAFRDMIALAKAKHPPFEAILVWKLNRFSRSRVDSVTYKTLLKSKGIRVISINEHLDESPSGQLLEGDNRVCRRVLQRQPGSGHQAGLEGECLARVLHLRQAALWLS